MTGKKTKKSGNSGAEGDDKCQAKPREWHQVAADGRPAGNAGQQVPRRRRLAERCATATSPHTSAASKARPRRKSAGSPADIAVRPTYDWWTLHFTAYFDDASRQRKSRAERKSNGGTPVRRRDQAGGCQSLGGVHGRGARAGAEAPARPAAGGQQWPDGNGKRRHPKERGIAHGRLGHEAAVTAVHRTSRPQMPHSS